MDKVIMTKIYKIEGMSCTSCAMKIENTLKDVEGITEVAVSYGDSVAYVSYETQKIDANDIEKLIQKLGYKAIQKKTSIEITNKASKKQTNNKNEITTIIGLFVVMLALYFIINNTLGFNFIPEIKQSMGYGILFVVGLLTSLHCIAMCGGINLSQCVSNKVDTDELVTKKLKPSILYNTGRVISYTLIGGIVGAIGSVISFSGAAKGLVAIIAGTFMIIMGLNMMNIFPVLRKIVPKMPKEIGNKIQGAKKGRGPLIVGLLNGFMPCGPLQTMQLYALGTGSFFAGAFAMFSFSLGTVPLMFGFGAISSVLSSKFTRKLMTVSATLVMILGVIMVGRGLNQSGVATELTSDAVGNIAIIESNVQMVSTNMEPNRYEPFVVQAGVPVKWTIYVEQGDLNGCNNPVTIPQYGIEKELVVGENMIEFTPMAEGNIVYTCWMGMISGNIKVVSDVSTTTADEIQSIMNDTNEQGSVSGCCSTGLYSEGLVLPTSGGCCE